MSILTVQPNCNIYQFDIPSVKLFSLCRSSMSIQKPSITMRTPDGHEAPTPVSGFKRANTEAVPCGSRSRLSTFVPASNSDNSFGRLRLEENHQNKLQERMCLVLLVKAGEELERISTT